MSRLEQKIGLLVLVALLSINAAAVDYRVINKADGTGWVIVAGDGDNGDILAYGDGSIDEEHLPPGMLWYMEQFEHAAPGTRRLRQVSNEAIAPLLTSKWDQMKPYNRRCPQIDSVYCATGCQATAMAQIMYYWKYPAVAPALPAYTTSTNKLHLPALPSVDLQWQDMLDKYIYNSYTDEQGDAVAVLNRYCGQACSMDYGKGGSSAFFKDAETALRQFGYNPSLTLLTRYNYDDAEWVDMMLEELSGHRPILYVGMSASTGVSHAFVIDGYDGSRFHINWGWGGAADGYFALGAFAHGYNDRHAMIFQVYPQGMDEELQTYDFVFDSICYKLTGDRVRVTHSPDTYRGDLVIPGMILQGCIGFPVTAIGPGAFADCPELTSVDVGPNVSMISEQAFARSDALRRIALSPSLQCVRHGAFNGCEALDTVDIEDLTAWCAIAFLDDEACPMRYATHLRLLGEEITDLVIPDGVARLGNNLFRHCASLTSVTIPASVKSIGNTVFSGCGALKRLNFHQGLTEIGYSAFSTCTALDTLPLPITLRRIGRYAFKGCTGLTRLVIPDRVLDMGAHAFENCTRLRTVTLGAALDTVGASAFARCTALDTITCRALVPPSLAAKSCFHSSVYANAVLLVPARSLDAYKAADYWKLFAHIDGVDMQVPAGPADVNADGEVNVADVNFLMDALLAGDRDITLDVNADGEVTLADVNAVINMILSSSAL